MIPRLLELRPLLQDRAHDAVALREVRLDELGAEDMDADCDRCSGERIGGERATLSVGHELHVPVAINDPAPLVRLLKRLCEGCKRRMVRPGTFLVRLDQHLRDPSDGQRGAPPDGATCRRRLSPE